MHHPDIEIYHHPNSHIRSYLTGTEISGYLVAFFEKPFTEGVPEDLEKRLGRIGTQLARELMGLGGVAAFHLKPKEIRIRKKTATPWETLEDRILEIVRRANRKSRIRLVKG